MGNTTAQDGSSPRFAIVLSGGGARGAYEAGILSYILDELPGQLGRPVQFDIVTGTSVGAIHACYLAATQGEENTGARLLDIWESLTFETAFKLRLSDLYRLPARLAGLLKPDEWAKGTDRAPPDRLAGNGGERSSSWPL